MNTTPNCRCGGPWKGGGHVDSCPSFVAPTINVNLKPCIEECQHTAPGGTHYGFCTAAPVLIPCPIPRNVTVTVTLGECTCGNVLGVRLQRGGHWEGCPARPIRVACSIGGKAWEESEVASIDAPPQLGLDHLRLEARCRDRWALITALLLGADGGQFMLSEAWAERWAAVAPLFAQRDTVFAALTDMARAEEALGSAAQRCTDAIDGDGFISAAVEASPEFLAAYVKHLLAQVGALS